MLTKPLKPAELFDAMKEHLPIEYLTKEEPAKSTGGKEAAGSPPLARLADLPEELKTDLSRLLDHGDLQGIEACVEKIRTLDPVAADALAEPLANFAFGSIAEALQSSKD